MGIKDVFEKWHRQESRVKELEIEDRAYTKLQQRKLSANERELNRFFEEKRQEAIQRELGRFRKEKSNELWHRDVISQKKNLFKEGTSMLKGKSILKGKRLFG